MAKACKTRVVSIRWLMGQRVEAPIFERKDFERLEAEGGCETKFRSGFGNLHKNAVLYIWLNILAKNYCRQEAGGGG